VKLLLFDWHGDGHHGTYMERAVEALSPYCNLVTAGPDDVLETLSQHSVDFFPLGPARPAPVNRSDEHELIAQECALVDGAVRACGVDRVLHLYSDPIIGHLGKARPLGVPTVTTLFYPRWHYPWTYRTVLLPRDAAKAMLLEHAVRRWRSRRDAIGIFSLDESAVHRWNRRSGARAFWFPEPPVADIDLVENPWRRGCILYGALAPRKGVDRLAAALARDSSGMHAVLAGSVESGYADDLDQLVDVMRAGGAHVDLRGWTHQEKEGLELLARARCAILPYHRHSGMSRVLLEAAAARTPVLVHEHGLIAALVREHGIGLVVDCGDPLAFRRALRALCADGEADRYRPALERFAAWYSRDRFAAALRKPFRLEAVEPAIAFSEAAR